jgi:hypothetical protein
MIVVGIHGKARAGKDTLANFLIDYFKDNYNKKFLRLAFADELKNMCKDHFNLTDDQLWGDHKETPDKRYYKGISPNNCGLGLSKLPSSYWTAREIMQEMGTFYRKISYDFWLDKIDNHISTLNERDFQGVIITDVRYKNESEYIKENGVLIKIVRDDKAVIHGSDHASEVSLDSLPESYFDIYFENDGDLKDLKRAAGETAAAIMEVLKLENEGGVV